jgi:predicted ATPase/DNA-binding CsgD family transcriptional regulator
MARPRRRLGNLPAEATSFVGRRRELAEVRQKLSTARVVSLVGPGGVGKTRLAIRSAGDLGRGFRAGAWMVGLAEVRDPTLVFHAVMTALDLRAQGAPDPRPVLLGHLRDKELLLLVDNCEHLLGVVAELVSLIVAVAPGVRVLTTSREPLSVAGEHVIPIPPLELPSAHGSEPLSRLRQNEAVTLFVERAVAAAGTFELSEANRTAVADVCRRLDGLPLALELAAVRTRVLSVEQILERLNDRFRLLVGGDRAALPRHQTLQTAIDWSYDLLADHERVLLTRLCVFAGRFTLSDVEEVCLGEEATRGGALEVLSSLVDKSLVVREDARGVACYRLHETMREYASRRLDDAGERQAVEERCTHYFVSTSQAAALESRFMLLDWLARMDLEIDNIRAVLRRCVVQGDVSRGIDLAASLGWYWITRAQSEGVAWLDELLASGASTPDAMAWSHFIRGFLGVLQGDWVAARPALERAIATARSADLPVQLVNALAMSSIAENLAGNHEEALSVLDEAGRVPVAAGDIPSRVAVLQARSLNAVFEGDTDVLLAAATEGVRLSRAVGDLYAQHMMELNLGGAALMTGDMAESRRHYEEGLRIAFQVDDRIGQAYMVAALGFHAAVKGRPGIAARLLGASETIRLSAGASVMAPLAPFIASAEESATEALGTARFRVEFEAGRGLDRETAVRLALGEADTTSKPSSDGDGYKLGARQLEVAQLVAKGLSNRQIASQLFLSERTVDSHVRTVLNKLGFNSRAQIAGWVASRD